MSRISELAANAHDVSTTLVDIPEWSTPESPCVIEVRGLDGNRRAEFLTRLNEGQAENAGFSWAQLEPELIVLSCFDPDAHDDTPCFTPEDIAMLMTKSGQVIGRLSDACMLVSGLGKKAEAALGKDSASPNAGSTLS